jgi:hypothetical protein
MTRILVPDKYQRYCQKKQGAYFRPRLRQDQTTLPYPLTTALDFDPVGAFSKLGKGEVNTPHCSPLHTLTADLTPNNLLW